MTTKSPTSDQFLDDLFLSDTYTPPKAHSSYMKLQDGDNRVRILASPVMGYEGWKDKQVFRHKMDDEPDSGMYEKPAKHFWSLIVYDHSEKSIKILNITQKSIIASITTLAKNPKWGDPRHYDIVVNRKGKDLETEYSVIPEPKEECAPELFDQAKKINLQALFSGEDPFENIK